jgi:hypothetical protein
VHLRIEPYLVEDAQIPQRPIECAGENGRKVKGLFRIVLELHAQGVRPFDLERSNAVDGILTYAGRLGLPI